MGCYHPVSAWYSLTKNPSGKRSLVFSPCKGNCAVEVQVPCGRCLGCRLEYSRQWAVRCLHEAKLHSDNVFVTLTYETVPPGGSLRPRDFQLFMKRLRITHPGVRYFQCGEYGETLSRPHHHAMLFNCWFEDRRYYKEKNGNRLFTSKELESLWSHGQCSIGDVTFESAAYCARYTMKKVYVNRREHYAERVPEYCTMSRRPGIGRDFIGQFRSEIYPADSVVVRGVECRPPRYYDKVLAEYAPSVEERVKAARRADMRREISLLGGEEAKRRQLRVDEECTMAAISTLSREVENVS